MSTGKLPLKMSLDGILQNEFHPKSSFDKTEYIFDRVFESVMVILINGFQLLELFLCGI